MEIKGSLMDHSRLDTKPWREGGDQQMLIVVEEGGRRGRGRVKVVSLEEKWENSKSGTELTAILVQFNKRKERADRES